MLEQTDIVTTEVDKLVQLVIQKKRISVDEAAKALSMPKVLVEEWADFLEEKDIIGIEYKFSVPYLVYKEITRQEAEERAKTFVDRKEGFVRKIDSVLQYLEHESDGLAKFKEEFEELLEGIEPKINHVKDELNLLSKYDEMKHAVDTQILEQEKISQEKRSMLEQRIRRNKKAVNRYLRLINERGRELGNEENIAKLLRKNEEGLKDKLTAIAKQAYAYEDRIKYDKTLIDEIVKRVIELKSASNIAKAEFELQKQKFGELVYESKEHQRKIEELKQKFFNKVAAVGGKNRAIDRRELKKVYSQFNRLFSQKLAAEKLTSKLDSSINKLKGELKGLSNEAMAMRLISNQKKDYTREFEQKFSRLSEKKENYHKQVGKLFTVLKKL